MENALVLSVTSTFTSRLMISLNPCFNGKCTRTLILVYLMAKSIES